MRGRTRARLSAGLDSPLEPGITERKPWLPSLLGPQDGPPGKIACSARRRGGTSVPRLLFGQHAATDKARA